MGETAGPAGPLSTCRDCGAPFALTRRCRQHFRCPDCRAKVHKNVWWGTIPCARPGCTKTSSQEFCSPTCFYIGNGKRPPMRVSGARRSLNELLVERLSQEVALS